MLVIILLRITLKYSILCTFSWFLVKLLLLIKTAQLTVRGSLNVHVYMKLENNASE